MQMHSTGVHISHHPLGHRAFSEDSSTQANHVYGAPLCTWGEWPGLKGEGASWLGVFSLFLLQILFTLLGGPLFGAEAVSEFFFSVAE